MPRILTLALAPPAPRQGGQSQSQSQSRSVSRDLAASACSAALAAAARSLSHSPLPQASKSSTATLSAALAAIDDAVAMVAASEGSGAPEAASAAQPARGAVPKVDFPKVDFPKVDYMLTPERASAGRAGASGRLSESAAAAATREAAALRTAALRRERERGLQARRRVLLAAMYVVWRHHARLRRLISEMRRARLASGGLRKLRANAARGAAADRIAAAGRAWRRRCLAVPWRRWLADWRRSNGLLIAATLFKRQRSRAAVQRLAAHANATRVLRAAVARGRTAVAAAALKRWGIEVAALHGLQLRAAAAAEASRSLALRRSFAKLAAATERAAVERAAAATEARAAERDAVWRALSSWRLQTARRADATVQARAFGYLCRDSDPAAVRLDLQRASLHRWLRCATALAVAQSTAGQLSLVARSLCRVRAMRRLEAAWLALPWPSAAAARFCRRRQLARGWRSFSRVWLRGRGRRQVAVAAGYGQSLILHSRIAQWTAHAARRRRLAALLSAAESAMHHRRAAAALGCWRVTARRARGRARARRHAAFAAGFGRWKSNSVRRARLAALTATAAGHSRHTSLAACWRRLVDELARSRFLALAPHHHRRGWVRATAFNALRVAAAAARRRALPPLPRRTSVEVGAVAVVAKPPTS